MLLDNKDANNQRISFLTQ